MRTPLLAAMLLALPLTACVTDGDGGRYGYDRPGRHDGYGRHRHGGRQIGDNDYIYRDNDGRYYCKRDDGTTGTIVGAIAGGVLGNVIAPGGSKTLGTILGGAGGALAGRAIDKSDVRCE
ncbi:glycine zipper 2TM domain-containing protein [Sphingobium estronivorans]|uniref:glycine zipper 2TM domain-containing protein n=1 Tax=Sphingobium estronivorans TaxID=1577690 RepID=UPI001238DFA2|nr:glycine zipper 2TM domain-containing protein [Sphingobium estronivorans]